MAAGAAITVATFIVETIQARRVGAGAGVGNDLELFAASSK
jgi:hypothetical protein